MRLLIPLLLALGLAGTPASAQRTGGGGADASAPEAIIFLRAGPLGAGPGDRPEIRTDAPATFPTDLFPSGAVVAAASVSASHTVVVLSLDSDRSFMPSTFEWELEARGWVAIGRARGFSNGPAIEVCRAGQFVLYQFRKGAAGNRLVRIALTANDRRACAPLGSRYFADVPVPTLALPDDARQVSGGGGSGGGDEMTSRTRIETAMTLDELMAYFVLQFEDDGWMMEEKPVTAGMVSVARFRAMSRAGEPVTGMLVLTAFPDAPSVDLMARFLRNKPLR